MILRRDGAARRDDLLPLPRSVPELGHALRRERTRQGLRVDEVSARTGLPRTLLDSLEAGTVDRLPDRVQTVKTLRGYADALGLPGDRYALVLIDLWPSYGGVAPPVVAVQGMPGAGVTTGVAQTGLATPGVERAAPSERVVPVESTTGYATPPPAETTTPDTPGELTETGVVPLATNGASAGTVDDHHTGVLAAGADAAAVTGGLTSGAVRRVGGTSLPLEDGTAQVPMVLADTGVVPAVTPVHRRKRSPMWLRVVIGLVALALVVGVAGLVIHQVRPQWLADIGVTSNPSSPSASNQGTHHHRTAPVFGLASSSPTMATFNVHKPAFVVKVVATQGPAWIQVTSPQQAAPLFAGTLPAGQDKDFVVSKGKTLSVQAGATSARVFVTSGFKVIGWYFPQAAPFTMVFHQVG